MEINYRSRKHNPIYNKVYQLWYNMNSRCHNTNNKYYKNYGEKGVVVCDRWRNLDYFIEDIDKIRGFDESRILAGELYLDKEAVDMKNKTYCIEKCGFVTIEDSNKRKPNQQKAFIATSPNGEEIESYNQSYIAKKYNLSQGSISACLRGLYKTYKGWTFKYK